MARTKASPKSSASLGFDKQRIREPIDVNEVTYGGQFYMPGYMARYAQCQP